MEAFLDGLIQPIENVAIAAINPGLNESIALERQHLFWKVQLDPNAGLCYIFNISQAEGYGLFNFYDEPKVLFQVKTQLMTFCFTSIWTNLIPGQGCECVPAGVLRSWTARFSRQEEAVSIVQHGLGHWINL